MRNMYSLILSIAIVSIMFTSSASAATATTPQQKYDVLSCVHL